MKKWLLIIFAILVFLFIQLEFCITISWFHYNDVQILQLIQQKLGVTHSVETEPCEIPNDDTVVVSK